MVHKVTGVALERMKALHTLITAMHTNPVAPAFKTVGVCGGVSC